MLMRLKILLLALFCVFGMLAKAQNPSGLPFPNAPYSYYHLGWEREDSGHIFPNRPPNFTPLLPFTVVGYLNPGVDSSLWLWTGASWIKIATANSIPVLVGVSPIVISHDTISCPTCGSGSGGITQLTGDGLAGPGAGSQPFTLATVNTTVGSFGDAAHVGEFTTNGKGLITLAGSVSIQITESQVTSLVSDLAGKQSTITTGSTSQYFRGDLSIATFPTNLSAFTNGPGYIATISGISAAGALAGTYPNPTLASVVTAGTCTNCALTYNAAGQITVASSGSGGGAITGGGGLSPLFTNGISGSTMTFTLSTAAANTVFGNLTGSTAAPSFGVPSLSNLNTWSGGSISLLGTAGTFTALQTFGTLTTTGVTKMTGLVSGLSTDSVVTWNSATGQLGVTSRTFSIYVANGLSASTVITDTFYLGGPLNQNTIIGTVGFTFSITGLPNKSTALSTDSVLVETLAGQIYKLPVPSGGGGDVITSPNTTLNIGGTSTNTTLDINLANANTWTAIQTMSANILFSANNTYNIGGTNDAASVNTQQVVSHNNQLFGIPTGKTYTWNINNVAQAEILSTGQWQWGKYIATSSFTLGTPVGMLVFDASGNIGTQAISGGGSVTINGTTGSVSGATLTFAQANSTSNTGLTIVGSGTTLTFNYPAQWNFWNNTNPANITALNVYGGSQVGNITGTGQENEAISIQSLQNITSGSYNFAAGPQALKSLTTGSQNLGIGWVALFNLTIANFNTAVGPGAMSGDTLGSENVALGGISWDLAGSPFGNVGAGYQTGGAELGAPRYNVVIGDRARSNTQAADSNSISIGALNQQLNLNHLLNTIAIGYDQEATFNADYINDINVGANTGLGLNKGILRNYTNIGNSVLAWQDSVANFATRSQVTTIGDSGVTTHAAILNMPKYSGGIVMERDSLGTGSGYFVYVVADAAWEQIPTTWHLPAGGGTSYTFTNSLQNISGTVNLVGDATSPGNNFYYGTNGSGTKGFYTLSATTALSSITAATATNFIDNTTFKQRWSWTGLAGDTSFSLVQNTTAATNAQVGFSELMEGTNGTASITTIAAWIQNAHTGTTAVNIGLEISSSGAPINYGLVIPNTSALNGFGTATPASTIDMEGSGSTELTIGSSLSTTTPNILFKASSTLGELYAVGSTYPSAAYNTGFTAASLYLRGSGAGGISIAGQGGNSPIRFLTGGEAIGNLRMVIDSINRIQIFDSVSISTTATGTTSDSVLTIGANRYIHKVAQSSLGGGATSVGAVGGPFTDAGSISGGVLTLGLADGTHAGVIAASGAQTLGATLTISNQLTLGNTSTRAWNPNLAIPGSIISAQIGTLNDASTAASSTVTNAFVVGITTPTLTATNTGVVYTNAYTLWVNAAPSASTNVTITNPYALGVLGNSNFLGTITSGAVNITGSADLTGQTGAVTVTTYAVPGSTTFNTFRVGGYLTVTAVSLDVIQLKVTWTDETSTSRTQSFFVQGATTGISATGANGYSPMDIRVLKGTTITVATVLTTGTGSITYDVGATITQLY